VASRFQRALEENPAVHRLGDVSIRYEPSLLIGEADRPKPGWEPVLGLLVGVAGACSLAAAALTSGAVGWMAGSLLATGLGFGAAAWLTQRAKRQRRFVLNFGTYALRLDFSTPITGRPKTMVMDFDLVRALDVREQGDGRLCLTVDFLPDADSRDVLREVLVAHVPQADREVLERLQRILHAAFDLDRERRGGAADDLGGNRLPD
jgi:hypothetical protein